MPNNNDIVRAIGDAIVQAAEYVNRDANDYSKSSIKNARIYGNQIKQNSVPGFVLKDGSIPGLKIVDLDFAKIKNVEIGNAHIANAGIDYAKIKDLHADSAYFGSQIFELGLGDELYIGRLRVNAANIAHLEVGELILESPDGTLYRLGVDEDGNVVTSVYEVQYQNIADMAKNLMSQYTIYRGTTAPETPYVGQLWVNTDTDIIKRCIAVTPAVIWEPIKASELHTSFINAVEKGLEILSTGVIDVKNGGNINIENGGNLNVRTSGAINVESGGQIKLQSSDAITIGGYPMDVGGANLLIDTSTESRETTFSAWQSTALHDITDEGIDLLKNGGQFTVKAHIKNLSGLEDVGIGVHLVRSGTPAYTQYNASSPTIVFSSPYIAPGDEGDVVLIFTAPADANIMAGYVCLRHDASDSGTSTASYSRFKLETGNVPTAWSPSEFDTSAALESLNSEIIAQIDGKVEMWYYNGVPLTTNAPASLWTTTELKDKHIGDLYYDLDTGIAYRYKTAPYEWEIVRDAGITQALEEVSTAQTTADGKMQVYTGAATPVAPYDIGDLWVVTGENGFVKVSTHKRDTTGYTNASDWTLSGTDTKADTAIDELTDIASDNKLTPVEKQFVKKEWDIIVGEYPKVKAEAESYELTAHAAYTAYTHATTGKYKLLSDYITPLLSSLTTTSSITGSVLRSTFKAYYDARQDLLNAITTKARTNLADFIDDVYEPAINTKNRIWYQPGIPTSSAVNDIWYDTDADPVKIYRANAANVSAIVTSGNGWYDITSVALDQALKGLNSLGNGSYHFFQSSTRPKSAGESGGSQINIGDIWLYTGTSGTKYVNGATYRAVSTNPTTDSGWLAFVAGAVLTPHIALDANHLTLSGEADLTIANPLGGNAIVMDKNGVVIESGSDLTIKDGYGGNVINMDNTGLTLSSTGQLKLQSTDSIIIGGSPFGVGGTNLIRNSSFASNTYTGWEANQDVTLTATSGRLSVVYNQNTSTPGLRTTANISASDLVVGETYTLSVKVERNNTTALFASVGGVSGLDLGMPDADISVRSVTFTYAAPASGDPMLLLYENNPTIGTGFRLYWAKLEKGTMATDWSPSPQDTVDALTGLGTDISGLQTQIDGKIDTYFGTSDPSSGWTAAQKAAAVGDMWYNSTAKKLKRWDGSAWQDINDQTAIDAYATASTAKDTADGKRRVFVEQPVPPYDIGDLWTGGPTGDLKKCKVERLTGSYTASDWELATKYTDDALANTAKETADTAAADAESALNQLTDIAADTKLTPVEKKAVKKEWDVIAGEKSKIDAEADEFSVSKTAYGNAYNALNTYLNGASGLLLNLNTTSSIAAATFRANFKTYYDARQDLLNAITSKAKTLADDAQTAADNAQLNLNNFVNNTYNPAIASKTTVFYGTSKPNYTAVGDIWYESTNGGIYRCTNVSTQAHTEITSVALKQALSAATDAQNTANGKINTFVGSSTPTALAAGDLWLDTGNKNIWKRATAAGTGGWMPYLTAAGYVNSTGITIDGTDLTVKATGNLNLAADGNLNVQNGGNLNVLNGGDIEVNNGGDINVASGGKINLTTPNDLMLGAQNITAFADGRIDAKASTIDLSANNSIKLAVSNIKVGGRNYIKNSSLGTPDALSHVSWYGYGGGTVDLVKGSEGDVRVDYTATVTGSHATGISTDFANDAGAFRVPGEVWTLSFEFKTSNWMDRFSLNYIYALAPGDVGNKQIFVGTSSNFNLVSVSDLKISSAWKRGIIVIKNDGFTFSNGVRIMIGCACQLDSGRATNLHFRNLQLEKGNKATDWSPAPEDPASGVKTSSVEVNSNGIYMDTTGTFNVNAGVGVNIKGGSGASSIGISNNDANNYFLWAGHGTPASAPFSVKRDGSVKATKIQHEMPYTFWDMADGSTPAEFPVYIPSGYTIDSVTFTFKTGKARTFAKTAASGGSSTVTSAGIKEGTAAVTGMNPDVQTGDWGPATVTSSAGGTGATGGINSAPVSTGGSGILTTEASGTGATGAGGTGATGGINNAPVATGGSGKLTTDEAGTGDTGTPSSNSTSSSGSHTHTNSNHRHKETGNYTEYFQTAAASAGSHSHTLSSHTHTGPSHTHEIASHTHTVGTHTHNGPSHTHTGPSHTHELANHSHTISTHTHNGPSHTHNLEVPKHSHLVGGHNHTVGGHSHDVTISAHSHGINYGINEKATLATSCTLKVGATTIGTYSPNPSNPVELRAYMSAGWNTVIVAPNNDARIVAFALVKLTPA